jgi:hypothetical protein
MGRADKDGETLVRQASYRAKFKAKTTSPIEAHGAC